jgi:hypothetical protein
LVAIRKNSKVPKGSVLKRGDLFDIVLRRAERQYVNS